MKRILYGPKIKGAMLWSIMAITAALSSCDRLIYDYEGDCTPHYKARFVFDRNMKEVDAFALEVDEVSLWLLNSNGSIVWSKTETTTLSGSDKYIMDIDAPAGTYEMIAWCRGENTAPTGSKGGFSFGGDDITMRSQLGCIIDHTQGVDGSAISEQDLHRLYHGTIPAFTFPDEEGEYVAEIKLTKDTNVVRVMLQQTEGAELYPDNFIFSIIDDNIVMDSDNNPALGNQVTYGAWSKIGASATVTTKSDAGVNCVIAELTTGRLMASDNTILHVTRPDGSTVLRIPLVRYALMVKGMYNQNMTDQEYLDRKDEYNMTFFLDEKERWISTVVMIESWRIVENTME